MANDTRDFLIRQFDTAWKLALFHLEGLSTEECLWRPGHTGLHVYRETGGGAWRADWPEHEGYSLGPPSIAWLTWHMGFFFSMLLDHSYGNAELTREHVTWPGTADAVREWLARLVSQWRTELERTSFTELQSTQRTRWPLVCQPFGDVVTLANVELTKNSAEIGYARFLYAVRRG